MRRAFNQVNLVRGLAHSTASNPGRVRVTRAPMRQSRCRKQHPHNCGRPPNRQGVCCGALGPLRHITTYRTAARLRSQTGHSGHGSSCAGLQARPWQRYRPMIQLLCRMVAGILVLTASARLCSAQDAMPWAYSHEQLAVAADQELIVRDIAGNGLPRRFRASKEICAISWGSTNYEIWIAACDGAVGLWNLETGQLKYLDRPR
jgi:hypothetical protein